MKKRCLVVAAALFTALGCGGGGGDRDGSAPDAGGPDGGDAMGAIEVTGNWDGAQPDGVTFDVAVFECPFTMPPAYFNYDGTIDADTGDVHAVLDEIPPGEWCLMAFIDMVPDDGLAPVPGTDAVNATGAENESGAIALDVVAGETTTVNLVFEVQ